MKTRYGHTESWNYGVTELRSCTQKGRFFLCTRHHRTRGLSPCASGLRAVRYVLILLVMMVVGVSGVWGQPFTVTTDEANPHYYLIQSFAWPSFYAVPYSIPESGNSVYTSTTNVPSENTLWYFMNSGTDGYYYIIHYSGNYLYHYNNSDAGIHIKAKFSDSATDAEKSKYLFSVEATGSNYFIHPKAGDYVNKAGGSGNYNRGLKKSTSTDENSQWIFVEFTSSGISWTAPFTLSEGGSKSFYKIKNAKNPTYFISQNADAVNTTNVTSDDMVWYFEEVPVSTVTPSFEGSDNYITYYYIRHRETDKYMCFNGSNAVNLQDKTASNEQSCQFIVVKSARAGATYTIMPKQLKNKIWDKNSIGLNNTTNGTAVNIRSDRGDGDNNTAHWLIEYVVNTSTDENMFPYLIQSMQCQYYHMIPNVYTDETTKDVNTLNVPSSTMLWYFKNAGITSNTQYYHITDANGWYLKHNGNDNAISLTQDKDNTDYYMFTIETNTNGGFNLMPKGATKPINKSYDNANPVKLSGGKNDASSRWNLKPYKGVESLPQWTDIPFRESTDDKTYYFRITSFSQPTKPIILNNSEQIQSETIPDGLDEKKTLWVINKVEPFDAESNPSGDDNALLDFYTFQNIYTGEHLFYKGGGRDYSKAVLQMGQPEGADLTWSHFVIVQTINGYNIIPRAIVDNTKDATSKSAYNCLNRRGGNDVLGTYFDSSDGSRWTFNEVAFCMPPVFEESGGNITISCATNGAEIHYTIDGSTPTASTPTVYTDETNLLTSSQYLVKAIAVFKEDPSDPSMDRVSSDVILFNRPDVTLSQNTYTYNKSACEPTVSKVAITISGTEYEAPTSPTISYAIDSYENYINAGTATVNLVDNDDTDNIFFFNFSKNFTISPVTLTVTADAKTKEYRDPDPELTYTITGLLEGDELTSPLVREEGENTGTYNIILASSLGNTNYTVDTFTGATFTITKKSLGDNVSTPAPNITCDVTETGGVYDVVVKQGGEDLTVLTDYTKDSESDGAKYYEVTVTGTGNYKDGFSVKLAKIQLSKLTGDSNPGGAALFVSDENDGDFEVPDDMRAYIVTGISGNTLDLEELDNIPEQVPVLLISDIDANSFLVQTKDNPTPKTGTNMLLEVTSSTSGYVDDDQSEHNESAHFNLATIYLLYNGEFVLNTDGYLAKGKIYLPRPVGAPSRLFIMWDETTDIENYQLSAQPKDARNARTINSQLSTDTWYTLDGRRLSSKPTKKGLYLMERKKVVVK